MFDILENKEFSDENLDFVNKILKYDHKNKVVVTSLFAEKYKVEIDGRFQTVSLGTTRIYKNELVKQEELDIFENQEQNNDYEDYELHLFKLKQTKKKS